MQLTGVLALVCFSTTVLSAPAGSLLKAEDTEATNLGPSDTLQLGLKELNNHQPITYQHKSEPLNEAIRNGDEFAAENNAAPEVKRSERVDTGDEPEDGGLKDNMQLADQEVKTVLKTFFQNLKHHPEIVEDILEREGAKLMREHPVETGSELGQQAEDKDQSAAEKSLEEKLEESSEGRPLAEENDSGDLPLVVSDFQKPSPQLIKIPKQVEKKAGALDGQPRFIYKSPMRDTKERDELTARSFNNPSNNKNPHNIVASDNNDTPPHVDLSHAIPVLQLPKSNEEIDEAEALLNNPEEGGDVDMAALERAEEEYNREHSIVNALPIIPAQPDGVAENEHISAEDVEQFPQTNEESEHGEDSINVQLQPDEKRSDETEVNSEEAEGETGGDESEGKWSETQVEEKPVVSVKSKEEQEVGKGSAHVRPSAYYYYYNEDELKDIDEQLDAAEEGEREEEDEQQLQKITSEEEFPQESQVDVADEDKAEEEVEEETNEAIDEPEGEGEEEVTNHSVAEQPESEEPLEADAEKTATIPHETDSTLKNEEVFDKNEADLLSLFRNAQQESANRPIAGPPM